MTAMPDVRPWLSIVGIGEDGLDGLSPAARALIDGARVLVGGQRHLALVAGTGPQGECADGRECLTWPSPLGNLLPEIERRRGQPLCVLASGDPFCFGIGATLARRIPAREMIVVPAPSAFSLACARLGWPLAEVETLTLHGRPLELLNAYVQPGARLLMLTEDGTTPAAVAGLLTRRGYGPSRLTVLEHMGGPLENQTEGTAAGWSAGRTADLNTLAVTCIAEPDAALLPRVPGLPDDAFQHDGQLTKREVRAITLAALAPVPGQLLWDVGAGCGSVAIEWLRCHRSCRAVAIERDDTRAGLIAANAAALGCPTLRLVRGDVPEALAGLEPPDAVFIGGGLSDAVFDLCWAALKPGGRLVANVVTLDGEHLLLHRTGTMGGRLVRLAVERAGPIGGRTGWTPLRTVTHYTVVKPWAIEP